MKKILVILLLIISTQSYTQKVYVPKEVLAYFLEQYEENEVRKNIIRNQDSIILEQNNRDLLNQTMISLLKKEINTYKINELAYERSLSLKDEVINKAEESGKQYKKQRDIAYGGIALTLLLLILSLL